MRIALTFTVKLKFGFSSQIGKARLVWFIANLLAAVGEIAAAADDAISL